MQRLVGPVMSRAIAYFAGQYFSPVSEHQAWLPNTTHEARCAIGCKTIPNEDTHQGCGFHGHWDIGETKRFVEQILGTADVIVLLECFGDIAVHAKGGRAQKGRIVAVLDWDPRAHFFPYPHPIKRGQDSQPIAPIASRYFSVPMLSEANAQEWIIYQAEKNGIKLACDDGRWSYPEKRK